MKNFYFLLLLLSVCTCVSAAENLSDWKLTGSGTIIDSNILEITGNGSGSGQWLSPYFDVQPGKYYRFSISINGKDASGGCLPCGINGFSRDYTASKGVWKQESFCFQTGENQTKAQFRCGQWESSGTFQFKDIKLENITPVLKQTELQIGNENSSLVLGEGEKIQDSIYTFNGSYYGEGTNIHRPFVSAKTGFNSNRWTFGGDSTLTYCFSLVPEGKTVLLSFNSAKVDVCVNYYVGGEGIVEASKDGNNWTEIGRFNKVGSGIYQLPKEFFPLDKVYVRITGLKDSSFQIDGVNFEAPLEKEQGLDTKQINVRGETLYATAEGTLPQTPDKLYLTDSEIIVISPKRTKKIPIQKVPLPGKMILKIALDGHSYSILTETNSFERTDYGYYIGNQVWWAEADWKVPRKRIVPAESTKKDIVLTAAKNDFEDFQVIVKAEDTSITGLTGKVSDLKNGSNIIPAKNVELLYAYYHFVHSKTDGTGMIADYPDALPPLDKPLTVPAGKNQPLWISVKVPADASTGTYTGTVELTAEKGMKPVIIPFAVKVWDFALPKENHHETAYGFNPQLACQYHNAKTGADKRKVIESYWQLFSDHRISIYDPVPFDGYSVKWLPDDKDAEKSRCEIDFSKYDAEMSRVLKKYHFTNFTVSGHGLGGGTYESRREPSLADYKEDTPQYNAMMTSYYTQLVNHLKEKGWLNKAYVYWFDEPEPKDYGFVAGGFGRLKHYAPGLGRMITEEPNSGFINALEKADTFINIWCPVSYNFDYDSAKKRMDKGERFWWYVCTGPKAPYCTLFIDHPATELRVWHWQARERQIAGSLVWQSNYWTSGTPKPQNPYEDPMGYVHGHYPAKWGNGDGRFIYPPLSAAVPDLNDGNVNFDKPVSSIRWEMIREGIEDYEMFYLLDELLKQKSGKLTAAEKAEAEKLLTVPESVTKTMTDFTLDPRPVYEHREKIGTMIEKISQR